MPETGKVLFNLEEAQQIIDGLAGRLLAEGHRELAEDAVRSAALISASMDDLLEFDDA